MKDAMAWAEDFNYDMARLLRAWHAKVHTPSKRHEAAATFSCKKRHVTIWNWWSMMNSSFRDKQRHCTALLLLNVSGCERGSTGPAWGPLPGCIAQWQPLTVRSSRHASCNANRRERSRRTVGSQVGSACGDLWCMFSFLPTFPYKVVRRFLFATGTARSTTSELWHLLESVAGKAGKIWRKVLSSRSNFVWPSWNLGKKPLWNKSVVAVEDASLLARLTRLDLGITLRSTLSF